MELQDLSPLPLQRSWVPLRVGVYEVVCVGEGTRNGSRRGPGNKAGK